MGYLHIDNLYKSQQILAFREIYALEKIHGTSAHLSWGQGGLKFFSGGEAHQRFVDLFDPVTLSLAFAARFDPLMEVTVYGEAYGGKQQGMSATYGKDLKFIAFDIQVGESWLSVPQAAELASHLGLDFVDFTLIPADMPSIDAERDKPSTQALRNGIIEPKPREGIVLRPPVEVTLNNGRRLIAKHKREEFSERATTVLDPTKQVILDEAGAIALEWVTPMRLDHVIDTLLASREDKTIDMPDVPLVIAAMIEDVTREGAGEILDSKPARKAISARTVHLFKQRLLRSLEP